MYMQSLTQLPFDKFQHLTLGASKDVAVVQNYTSVFDYQVVKSERAKIIQTQMQFHQHHHVSPISECFQVICGT